MKTIHINSFLLIVLVGLIIYQSFLTNKALDKGQHIAKELATQIDSLQSISDSYQRIHQDYVDVHQQLVYSQHRITRLSGVLARISTDQQTDVELIRDHLQEILSAYDTLQLQPLSTMSNDEIPYQP
jgi:hypothetical protein